MTTREKELVISMRQKGTTFSEISGKVGVSLNTVKSFCYRNNIKPSRKKTTVTCKYCGNEINLTSNVRNRKFCDYSCRMAWWKEERQKYRGSIGRECVCAFCGKTFKTYRKQKYCSHPCYIKARFGHE